MATAHEVYDSGLKVAAATDESLRIILNFGGSRNSTGWYEEMTTYAPEHEIYSNALRAALTSGKSISDVLNEIREIRRNARMIRKEARMQGFTQPYVSYIPAYGTETSIRALIDYCRLRRMAAKSNAFASWFAELAASPEQESAIDLLMGPREARKYHEREGEQYMGEYQLEHFRGILKSWKRDLSDRFDQLNARLKLLNKLQGVDPPIVGEGMASESKLAQEPHTRNPELRLILKIDDALARIDQGSFGFCIETGKPIGLKRLSERPIETLCSEIRDQREHQREKEWFRDLPT